MKSGLWISSNGIYAKGEGMEGEREGERDGF